MCLYSLLLFLIIYLKSLLSYLNVSLLCLLMTHLYIYIYISQRICTHSNELLFVEFVVLILVAFLEDLSHGGCHVHIASIHSNLNEEGHHVEELLDADVIVAVLVKQVEHLNYLI